MRLCVNWGSRYKLNKEVKRKTSEMRKLIAEAQRFEVLSTPLLPPSVEHMNVSGYVETDSSKFLMQKITDLLVSGTVKAIGVWGMGGAGKTTLVQNLNNYFKNNSIFDKVIFLTISHNPDWKKLHKEIAEKIGITPVDYEDGNMRVNMLYKALGKKKSVLFILDDVWTSFKVPLLGMRDDQSDVSYKLIITTRDLHVLDQMGVGEQGQFELCQMSEEDSWKLFQAKADYVANLPAIEPIAIELCHRCGGSPLAICTFASALRGDKKQVSWNGALRALDSSDQALLSGIFMPVFTSIEFSFDRLRSENVKLCFLYCCTTHHRWVHFDDIRSYGISRKVIRENSVKEASERVRVFVEELRKSSLLVAHEDENFVTMHDIVREVALWIASKKKYGFVVKFGQQLLEIPIDENMLHLSVSASKINKLPNSLCCPSLLALDMSDMDINKPLQIHNEFFSKTKKLQFLDISRIGISKIPDSLYDLIHLCSLDLRGLRNLRDISSIGKLECLEILILDDTGIKELPIELGNLKSLRLFHMKNTHKLKRVAPNIINQLRALQELNMENSFNLWERNGENGVNASLSEIFGLPQLTTLHLEINDPLCLQNGSLVCVSLSNLEKFSIVVATSWDSIKTERRYMRYLSLANIPLGFGYWICKLFEVCEYVNLNGSDVVDTLPYQQIMGFNCLIELRISNLGLMKHVIDCHLLATKYENDVFPSLEQLVLEDMESLECVCNNGSVRGAFFSKLKIIKIHNCKNLKVLFKGSMDQALQNLTDIQIHGCDELKAFTNVEGPTYFQKLKKIEVKDCGNLEILLAAEADWECLETICVTRCGNLLTIFHKSLFPQNLKHLKIKKCENLTTSVSSLIQRSFSTIETIKVAHCNPGNVEYLLSTNEIDKPSNTNVFENLKVLWADGFDGKGIFNGPMSQFSLQNLAEVQIVDCNDLTSIWVSRQTFPFLEPIKTLLIVRCNKLMLKEVFLPKEMGYEFALRVEELFLGGFSQITTLTFLPQASLKYLKNLQVGSCENLKYLLPRYDACILNHLNTLVIQDCCNLENIIIQNSERNCDLRGQALNNIIEDVGHDNLICTSETSSLMTNITQLWIVNCSRLDLRKLGLTLMRISYLLLKRLPQLESLTQLQSLCSVGKRCEALALLECENLEKLSACEDVYILNDCENLYIYNCPKLLTLIAEEDIVSSPSSQKQAFTGRIFRNLNSLFIGDCHNIKNIFSISTARSLIHLEYIDVFNCEEIREIVAFSDSVEAYYADLFPCLKSVRLYWLPKIECFCRGNTILMWPSFMCGNAQTW